MILYIGNYLMKHGLTPTMCESLSRNLSEKYTVIKASNKLNIFFRLTDMIFSFLIYSGRVRLVIIDTYSYKAFWYAYLIGLLSKIFNKHYIPIIRGGDFNYRLIKSRKPTNFLLSNAYKIVVLSEFMKDLMIKNDHNNVIEIPNFLDIEEYNMKLREFVSPKLLWVRSLHKIYNPQLAIELIEKLVERGIDAELCMVGPDKDGTLKSIKQLITEKGLEKNITLTGKLNKKEWIKLSENFDIFINTTNYDNYPMSVIEAMALGLPVISTNVGGVPYLIKNNIDGFVVLPNETFGFINQIEYLINNAEIAKKISLNARKKVEELDWEIIKQKWFNLIDPIYN